MSARFPRGAIAYAAYYHVRQQNFLTHLNPTAGAMLDAGINRALKTEIVHALADNQRRALSQLPLLSTNQTVVSSIIRAGQEAFAPSYPIAKYVSTTFGDTATIACLFLSDIT